MIKKQLSEPKYALFISRDDLILAFKTMGWLKEDENAEIFLPIPGGGDYSNMDLEIEGDEQLKVIIK